MKEKSFIALNATLQYVIAFLLTTMLHELAHFVAGLINGSGPVLHHNYVEHLSSDQLSITQQATIALAGPTVSLLQGMVTGWLFMNSKKQSIIRLFLMWFSVLGFTNFLGYLMTGPIFTAGDIGKTYLLLETPLWVQIFKAILGAAALLFIAYKLTTPILNFSYKKEWVATPVARKNFSLLIIILPWIFGSATMTVLYLPIIAIVSIIYPFTSGFVFIFPWQNAQGIENVELSHNDNIGKLSIVSIITLVMLTLLFKVILGPGVSF